MVNEGSAIALTGSFTDSGINDTHTVTWDFGDFSVVQSPICRLGKTK
ncbi:MAG: hypothetical protein ACRC1Z_01320 [Waterburya sp.]